MQWFFLKLGLFNSTQQKYLNAVVTQTRFNQFSIEDQNLIIYLFSKLDIFQGDESSLNLVYDFLVRKFLYDTTVKIFEVSQGENVDVVVVKEHPEDEQYTGDIVIREAKTKKFLGSIPANNQAEQVVRLVDLDLVEAPRTCGFFKLQVCVESSGNTPEVADATSLLSYIYFMVGTDIDTP